MTEQELREMSNARLLDLFSEYENYIALEEGYSSDEVFEAANQLRAELLRRLEHYNGKSI